MALSIQQSPKNILLLALVCVINFIVHNSSLSPDIMEARNLITAREMVENSNWLNPTMNGYPRLAKPPLPTWINAAIALSIPVDDLSVHRVPSAVMGFLMVIAIYYIAREVSSNNSIGLYSGLVASTSYYLILMSRQATWDIYCHALMALSVMFLVFQWKSKKHTYKYYILSGLFMGLSFMSKGPVSFYAVLLPLIIAWAIAIGKINIKNEWKGLTAMLLVFLLFGLSWPIYQLFVHPDLLLTVVENESQAWIERHPKPFYQYWGFWSHSGVWSFLALSTLIYPYMKERLPLKQYRFFLFWLIATVVLLSIPVEKKERYLLPVLIPLSCLIGYYVNYLILYRKLDRLKIADKVIVKIFIVLLVLASLALPITIYLRNDFSITMVLPFVIFLGLAILFISSFQAVNFNRVFIGVILLMSSSVIYGIKAIEPFSNPIYKDLKSIRKNPHYQKRFYSTHLNPKQIFDIGKKVDTLTYINDVFYPAQEETFVFVSYDKINAQANIDLIASIPYNKTEQYDLLYFYLVNIDNKMD